MDAVVHPLAPQVYISTASEAPTSRKTSAGGSLERECAFHRRTHGAWRQKCFVLDSQMIPCLIRQKGNVNVPRTRGWSGVGRLIYSQATLDSDQPAIFNCSLISFTCLSSLCILLGPFL